MSKRYVCIRDCYDKLGDLKQRLYRQGQFVNVDEAVEMNRHWKHVPSIEEMQAAMAKMEAMEKQLAEREAKDDPDEESKEPEPPTLMTKLMEKVNGGG